MPEKVTKVVLVEQLHARVGLNKRQAAVLVDDLLDTMGQALVDGEKVKIAGFGNFLVRDKSARRGRNPQTNEEIIISRRRVVTFKPSQVLRGLLNDG